MFRNFAIATAVVGVAIGLWFALSDGDPRADNRRAFVAEIDDDTPAPFDDSEFIVDEAPAEDGILTTDEATLDLETGSSGIGGVVLDAFGSTAPGARITLYKSDLVDLEEDGGASVFELIERNFRSVGSIRADLRARIEPLARVRADADGRYSFTGVGDGEYLIAGSASGSLTTPAARVSHLEGESQTVDVELRPAGRLTGRVLDPTLAGVGSASLRVSGELIDTSAFRSGGGYFTFEEVLVLLLNDFVQEGETDSGGEFAFLRLPMLTYEIRVDAPPWAATYLLEDADTDRELEIILDDGAALSAQVFDDESQPIPDVEVSLRMEGGGRGDWLRNLRNRETVVADGDGLAQFEGLAAGEYRIQTSRAGYQSTSQSGLQVESSVHRSIDVTMDLGGVLAGVIVDDDGQPVAEADVSADLSDSGDGGRSRRRGGFGRWGGNDDTRTKTDERGRFRLDRLVPGQHRLTVRADRFIESRLEAETDRDDLQIAVTRGVSITGKIVDGAGEPIARARIQARTESDDERDLSRNMSERMRGRSRSARSEADGSFEIDGLKPGAVALSVRAEGYLTAEFEVATGDVDDLILDPAPRISGVVTGPDGAAVVGARVSASAQRARRESGGRGRRGGRSRRSSGTTDGDGAYVVFVADPESDYTVTARAKGYLDGTERDVNVSGGDIDDLDLRLEEAAQVFGDVRAHSGESLVGVQVTLSAYTEPTEGEERRRGRSEPGGRSFFSGQRSGRSDIEGRYEADGLEPGTYRIRARVKGYASYSFTSITVVEGGRSRHDIVLHPELRLAGTVVDAMGVPIGSARVSVSGPDSGAQRGNTSEDGTFSIGGLSADELTVTTTARGFKRDFIGGVVAGGGPIEVVLEVSYTVSGIVLDSSTGQPIPDADLRLTHLDPEAAATELANRGRGGFGRRGGGRGRTRTDQDGEFRLRDVVAGAYQLEISAEGFRTSTMDGFMVGPSTRIEALEYTLQPGARVIGLLVDQAGNPIAEARIRGEVVSIDTEALARQLVERRSVRRSRGPSARSDDDGSFVLGGLDVANYKITVTHSEFITYVVDPHEVDDPETGIELPVRWALERGAEISGNIFANSGSRVESGRIRVRGGPSDESKTATVGDDGSYFVGGLLAGTYTVSYFPSRSRQASVEVSIEVRAKQERTEDLRLP